MNQTVRRQPALQRLNYHEETVILQKKNVNQNAKRWIHGIWFFKISPKYRLSFLIRSPSAASKNIIFYKETENIEKAMMQQEDINETLKASNQLEWGAV